MFTMYIPHELNNSLSLDTHYLIFQTMRLTNQAKMFWVATNELRKCGAPSAVTGKKLNELFLQHAANLYEIIFRLFNDKSDKRTLYARYKEALKDEETLQELDRLRKELESKDREILVLKEIRNKHSAHIATDGYYAWQGIKNIATNRDIPVAVGESRKAGDWFFTLDLDQIFGHIKNNILKESVNVQEDVYRIITQYTLRLIKLFAQIGKELFEGFDIRED
jgi:hypothetical protein